MTTVDADRLFGEPPEELCAIGHFTSRLGQRLAHLGGHDQRQILLSFEDQFVCPAEDVAACARRCCCPALLGGRGRLDGRSGIGLCTLGDVGDDLTGGGVLDREGGAVRCLVPFAADVQAAGQ